MSRADDINGLIVHLNVAMDYARRLKVANILVMLSMVAVATMDIPVDSPDEDGPVPSRDLH
jgi:hypothetical protein